MRWYAGVDIGGTNTVIAITGEDGEIRNTCKVPTNANLGYLCLVQRIASEIQKLCDVHNIQVKQLSAVGVGVPGFVDPVRGVSVRSVNLGWCNVSIADALQQELDGPMVFIDNDVRLYVYGEAMVGAGHSYQHVMGLTIGTGLAMAMVNDGELFYGSGGRAGEIGHVPLDTVPYRCRCGMKGCIETVVSGPGMVRQAIDAISHGTPTILSTWHGKDVAMRLTSADISRGYDSGDQLCQDIMHRTGTVLGRALAIVTTLFSPDIIVIGGGVAEAGVRLILPAQEELERHVMSIYRENLKVVQAKLSDDAGVIGSALFAKKRLSEIRQ